MLTLSAAAALVESAQPLLRAAESYLAELPGTAKDGQLANDATFIVGLLARLRSSLADRLQAEHLKESDAE